MGLALALRGLCLALPSNEIKRVDAVIRWGSSKTSTWQICLSLRRDEGTNNMRLCLMLLEDEGMSERDIP